MMVWVLLVAFVNVTPTTTSFYTDVGVYITEEDCMQTLERNRKRLEKKFKNLRLVCKRKEVR